MLVRFFLKALGVPASPVERGSKDEEMGRQFDHQRPGDGQCRGGVCKTDGEALKSIVKVAKLRQGHPTEHSIMVGVGRDDGCLERHVARAGNCDSGTHSSS